MQTSREAHTHIDLTYLSVLTDLSENLDFRFSLVVLGVSSRISPELLSPSSEALMPSPPLLAEDPAETCVVVAVDSVTVEDDVVEEVLTSTMTDDEAEEDTVAEFSLVLLEMSNRSARGSAVSGTCL